MVSAIYRHYQIPYTKAEIVEKLLARKLDESILMPCGTTIPHIHLDNFFDTIIAIFVPERPIETEHGVIKIIFMVITGKKENTLYLHILQSIVKISKDAKFFQKLVTAKTNKEFYSFILESDFFVKRAISVDDVMNSNIFTVTRDMSLEELSDQFTENDLGYFLVVDDDGKLIGDVSVLDYLMAGFPAFTHSLKNLKFVKSFEPFERLLNDEASIKVEAIMKPVEVYVKPTTNIIEAVFLMNKHSIKDIAVVSFGKPVGIVSFMDIFKKIIKG
jgi:CBS domain-containing protein